MLFVKEDKVIIPKKYQEKTTESEQAVDRLVESYKQFKFYMCYYCGNPIEKDSEKCLSYQKELLQCNIYKLPISFGEEIGICDLCETKCHLSHLQEWVKVQGKCPNCLQEIPLEGITILEQEGKKSKK